MLYTSAIYSSIFGPESTEIDCATTVFLKYITLYIGAYFA